MPDAAQSGLFVALIALVASGCATSGQRSDAAQAQAEIATCRTAARTTADQAACSARFGQTLAKIAQDNFDQAGRAQDRATRINLYATAASAGWDSGTIAGVQVADAAIQAGGAECEKIPGNEFSPARDCALLQVGPGFVAHVRTTISIAGIESRPRASVPAAEKKQFADTSVRYVRNTFDFIEARRRQFDSDPGIDESVGTLLDRQRTVFYCTALQIAAVNRRLGQGEVARRVSRDRDRILAAAPSLQGETCLVVQAARLRTDQLPTMSRVSTSHTGARGEIT